jgi:hypothetical protein
LLQRERSEPEEVGYTETTRKQGNKTKVSEKNRRENRKMQRKRKRRKYTGKFGEKIIKEVAKK